MSSPAYHYISGPSGGGKNFTNFMLDLETLATTANAAVTQIGLVAFDPFDIHSNRPKCRIKVKPHPECYIDPKTVYWWMGQSEEARKSVFDWENSLDPDDGLFLAQEFLYTHSKPNNNQIKIWAMPAKFDVTILEHLFSVCHRDPPWAYNSSRDVRTVLDLANISKEERVKPVVEHDAMLDSDAQSLTVCRAIQLMGLDK